MQSDNGKEKESRVTEHLLKMRMQMVRKTLRKKMRMIQMMMILFFRLKNQTYQEMIQQRKKRQLHSKKQLERHKLHLKEQLMKIIEKISSISKNQQSSL
jgi:hypothetical protein